MPAWVFDHLPDRNRAQRGPEGLHAANAAGRAAAFSRFQLAPTVSLLTLWRIAAS